MQRKGERPMNIKKMVALVATGALAASLALFGCSSGDQGTTTSSTSGNDAGYTLVNDGKLTVAASLDFPPFENLNGDKPEGFAVDLMTLLAEEMGLECEYLPSTKFDTIVPLIQTGGKADVEFTAQMRRGSELFGKLERLDFIKCDIEGYEVIVMREMRPLLERHRPTVLIETGGENRPQIVALFTGLGYTGYTLDRGREIPLTDDSSKDIIFRPGN